jgi:hypothetical protein
MEVTCVNKFRDKQGNILGYLLKDNYGRTLKISHAQLKKDLANRKYIVDNLQIDKAGRLVDRAVAKPVNTKQPVKKVQNPPQTVINRPSGLIDKKSDEVPVKKVQTPQQTPQQTNPQTKSQTQQKNELSDSEKDAKVLAKLRDMDWSAPINTLLEVTKAFFRKSNSFTVLYTPGGSSAGYTFTDENKIEYEALDFCISDKNIFHIDDTIHNEVCCDLIVYMRCQDKKTNIPDLKITDKTRNSFLSDATMKVKRRVNACASIIYFVESNRNLVHKTSEYGLDDRQILVIEIDKHDKKDFGITCVKFLLKALGNYTFKDLGYGIKDKYPDAEPIAIDIEE